MHKEHIFREYDIRGVYKTDFDTDFARALGKAYAFMLQEELQKSEPLLLTVGYDARLSSPEIVKALVSGFIDSGADVKELGLVTTPMSYFSMFHLNADGGIMVTGSHNPPEYNGFKISKGKSTIFGDEIQKLAKIIRSGKENTGVGRQETIDIHTPYIAKHTKEFGTMEDIPMVLDCGNGAAGAVVRKLYEALGLKPTILFEEPDGRFPNHHPDPTVEENMDALKAKVKETGAKIGIGFDGDADRIGVVDQNGRFLLGDEIMMILARDILEKNPGAKIIGDVKCSDHLYTDIKDRGGEPIMWKTGHSLIKNKIKEEKAPFGGELSGHIFFSDRNFGFDDAPYAGLRLIEILVAKKQSIDQLLAGVPKSFSTPEIRLETSEENKVALVKALQEHFAKPSEDYTVNTIDGVRVSFKDGWALVRASNTQPAITIRFESHSQQGLQRIETLMMELINPLL